MSNRMAYDEQEEICFQVLRWAPISFDLMEQVFREAFAVTLTRGNFAAAKRRTAALPPRPLASGADDKERYVRALWWVASALRLAQVRTKTRMFFGEDTQDQRVRRWQAEEQRSPLFPDLAAAQAWVAQVEGGGPRDRVSGAFSLAEVAEGEGEL